jgi:kynurenine formamidase
MKNKTLPSTLVLTLSLSLGFGLSPAAAEPQVGRSPWGPKDELGRLNLMTAQSRTAALARLDPRRVYDLSVEYFIGMPSWQAAGDPPYQMWMTHTPHGNVVADPMKLGAKMNEHVSYSGAAVSMYAHMGTHIDALNHFGLGGKIYNGFSAHEHLGDRGWTKTGAETIPPLVARGVLLDVAAAKGVKMLAPNYKVTKQDLELALRRQSVALAQGDVVLIRTGRMQLYGDANAFMKDSPGMSLSAARFLVESGAMVVGADNLSFESFPPETNDNYIPVHTYLLAQNGVPIIELVYLEDLARDGVYEFAFFAASLKLRGADAAPLRPVAIPLSRPRR